MKGCPWAHNIPAEFYCKTWCFLSDDFPLTSCMRQVKMPKHRCSWEQISTNDRWKLVGTYTSFLSLGREPNIAFNKLLLQKFRERITTVV